MDTVYFILVSLGIAYVIFWAYKNDDQADFMGQKRDEKFSTKQAGTDVDDTIKKVKRH